jgi:uncharacterized membrane protein
VINRDNPYFKQVALLVAVLPLVVLLANSVKQLGPL